MGQITFLKVFPTLELRYMYVVDSLVGHGDVSRQVQVLKGEVDEVLSLLHQHVVLEPTRGQLS